MDTWTRGHGDDAVANGAVQMGGREGGSLYHSRPNICLSLPLLPVAAVQHGSTQFVYPGGDGRWVVILTYSSEGSAEGSYGSQPAAT